MAKQISEAVADSSAKRRWTRRRILLWTVIGILVGVPTGLMALLWVVLHDLKTGGPLSSLERETHVALRKRLDQDATRIPLPELFPFGWERACMAAPYFGKSQLEKEMGRRFASSDALDWVNNEGFWTLVIVIDKEKMRAIRIPRREIGDHSLGDKWISCVDRDASALAVTRNADPLGLPVKFSLSGS